MRFLLVIACIDMALGIVTDKHYLVTDGLILLVIGGISEALGRLREIERRLDR
jgi:hypothetical protein